MKVMSGRLVINITGASSGFGALTARALAKRGHTVYAGLHSLRPETLDSIRAFNDENATDLRHVQQDMLSDDSVSASVQHILQAEGHLDAVIHNCGHMVYGPTEAFSPEQLAHLYNVNVLSTQRLNRAVLPHMRQRRSGLLVWVGSSSTLGSTPPFLAPYFAAKAGMDALAQSYRLELSRWGIESVVAVPGAFTSGTNHFKNASHPEDHQTVAQYEGPRAPYEGVGDAVFTSLAAFEPPGADVGDVAQRIADVVDMAHGTRPERFHVDPAQDGAEEVSAVRDRIRRDWLRIAGHADLLTVQKPE
jgi:NAD(P)-dependent dehydrogenase (short-subunit alcohol dehydrogenase family)